MRLYDRYLHLGCDQIIIDTSIYDREVSEMLLHEI